MMVNGYSIEPRAILTGADLTNTNLSGTILKGATMPDGAVNN